jgi:hypothetical protein
MRPEEIGELLGTDPESVVVAREHALEHLAATVGSDSAAGLDAVRARLAELPGEAWVPPPRASKRAESAPPQRAASALPQRAAAPLRQKPSGADRSSRRPRLPLLLLAVLAVAVVAAVVLISSRSGGDGNSASKPAPAQNPAPATPTAKPQRPKPPQSPQARLTPVSPAGADVSGTARLTDAGKRLQLTIEGLPNARGAVYQVWLYNSVIDSRNIGGARGTKITLSARLPKNIRRYRFIDVSREPADGNRNHSGASIVRVPVAKLTR